MKKWILCGKNDAAVKALEHLVEQGDEVWVVATRSDDGEDSWQRSLIAAAQRLGVPVDQPRRVNDPSFIDRLGAYRAQALISIQYDQILKAPLLESIGCPCLNLHFALLPRHRGVAPMAWAILDGDSEAGVTLHHMVVDIDAGDVLKQRAVSIGGETTARDLYNGVSEAAVQLFRDSYPFPRELLTARLAQNPSLASYHRQGDLDFSLDQIDWNRPASELQLWLRAMIFPPFQYPRTECKGRELRLHRISAGVGSASDADPGTVVAVGADGIEVAAKAGTIRVRELAGSDGAGSTEFVVGDRLGTG